MDDNAAADNGSDVEGEDESIWNAQQPLLAASDDKVIASSHQDGKERKTMQKKLKHDISELLESYKGVIPDRELNRRKRVLNAKLRGLGGRAKNKKQWQTQQKGCRKGRPRCSRRKLKRTTKLRKLKLPKLPQ